MPAIDKHTPGTICWVDLMTTNAESAREFYKNLFGWSFTLSGPEAGHYGLAKLDEKQVAGLGPQPPGAQFPPAWSVYFATDSVDDTLAKVTAHGGSIMMGPMDVMEEGRMAFFVDPTGAAFGVWQPKRHSGAQLVEQPGTMTWWEVATADAAKACDFYCKVFGLEPKKVENADDPPTDYYMLHKGPKTVGGVKQMTKESAGVPPHWMAYFAVADCDAAAKRVTELGGKVSVAPFNTAYGRFAIVNDPQGAAFAVVSWAVH